MSTGVKAAIGVVVPVAVLAAIGLLFGLVLRRRRRRRPGSADLPQYRDKPELDASNTAKPKELSSANRVHELGSEYLHELAAPNAIHELQNSERGSVDNGNGNLR